MLLNRTHVFVAPAIQKFVLDVKSWTDPAIPGGAALDSVGENAHATTPASMRRAFKLFIFTFSFSVCLLLF
jgi:hypothetical protein